MIGRRQRKRVVFVDGIPIEATILNAGASGLKGEERSDPAALAMLDPRALFDKYDTDGSGGIDFDEFSVLLADLQIALPEPKARAYFRKCDALRRGSISFDEFRLALFTCDPKHPSRTTGFAPGQALAPKDVFAMFDTDDAGMLDRETFIRVLAFLGKTLPLADMEAIFAAHEDPELEMMPYVQFKKAWLSLVDVRAELRSRHEPFNRFLLNAALVKKLEAVVTREEQEEVTALLEAANSLDDERIAQARRALVDDALMLARVVLSDALDAAGQVYIFGSGPFGCLDGDAVQPDSIDFMDYERVQTLWRARVRPDAAIAATVSTNVSAVQSMNEPETIDDSNIDTPQQRTVDYNVAAGRSHHHHSNKPVVQASRSRIALDAAARAFSGRHVSLVTAFLWGKRVQSVACGASVAFAVTGAGEVFCWGGKRRTWGAFYDVATRDNNADADAEADSNEQPTTSNNWTNAPQRQRQLATDPLRPLTTRTEMLKLSTPTQHIANAMQYTQLPLRRKYKQTFVKPAPLLATERDKQMQLLLIGRYYDLVPEEPSVPATAATKPAEPLAPVTPQPTIPTLDELMETVEPALNVDDLVLSLQMRGVYLAKQTRMEMIDTLGACLALECECVGAAFHAHMKAQDIAARRHRSNRRETPMLAIAARTAALWSELGALQQRIATAERDAFAADERAFVAMQRSILAATQKRKRQAREGFVDDSDANQLLRASGLTARGAPLQPFNGHHAVAGIAVGSRHALAIQQSGKLLAWGVGSFGRLGGAHDAQTRHDANDPATWHGDVYAPAVVDALAAHRFRAVACGFGHSLALSTQGHVYVWGSATLGKLGIGDVAAAESFTVAPLLLPLPTGVVVRTIACGPSHSALLTTDGHLYVWGCGDGGKLGLGDARDVGQNRMPRNGGRLGVVSTPTRVIEPFGHEKLVDVSCGASHTVVLNANNSNSDSIGGCVFAAGSSHALARFSPTFTLLPLTDSNSANASIAFAAARVSCGTAHTAVVTTEGELFTWGANTGGCTGHDVLLPRIATPTRVRCLYQRPTNLCLRSGVCAEQSSQTATCRPEFALQQQPTNDVAQTQQEACPFWQVTLQQLSHIERVRVVAVVGDGSSSGSRLAGSSDDDDDDTAAAPPRKYVVLISASPFDTDERGTYALALARAVSTHATFTLRGRYATEFVWTLPVDTFGRFVRVQLETGGSAGGSTMLGLRAVEVIGMASSEYNGPRVSDVTCGDAVTAVVCRPLSSPAMLRERFVRAVRADRASLTVLQQLETFHPFLQDDLVQLGHSTGYSSGSGSMAASACVLCRPKETCVVCQLENAIVADSNVTTAVASTTHRPTTAATAGVAAAQQRERDAARRDALRLLSLDELCHTLLTMSMRTEEEDATQQQRLMQELEDLNALAVSGGGSSGSIKRLGATGLQMTATISTGTAEGPVGTRGFLATLRRVLSRDRAASASAKVVAGATTDTLPVATTRKPSVAK